MSKPLRIFSMVSAIALLVVALYLLYASLFAVSIFAGEGMPAGFPTTPQPKPVKAELFANTINIVPGQPFRLGILFKIDPEWHIYWKNPGDAGLATEVELDLPEGFSSSEIFWPLPKQFIQPGNLLGYGYENRVMLLAEITPPDKLQAGEEVQISARASWLGCRDICVQGSATLSKNLTVAAQSEPANLEIFAQWSARLPGPEDSIPGIINLDKKVAVPSATNSKIMMTISWKGTSEAVEFFPAPAKNILFNRPMVETTATTNEITLVARHTSPDVATEITGLLIFSMPGGERKGFWVTVQLPTRNADAPRE